MTPADIGAGIASDYFECEAAKVARIDAAAEHMVRRLKAIDFCLAQTPAEREAAYRLRYRVVMERGWQPPVALENGIECDAIDERAHHMIGWRDGHAIAHCRIICPEPGQPLPMEQIFGIPLPPTGDVVQFDRICIDREYSDRRSELLLGLLCASWQLIHRLGYRYVAGFDSAPMLRIYGRIGLEHTPLGSPRFYWGEERYPSLFKPLEVDERFFARVYADR